MIRILQVLIIIFFIGIFFYLLPFIFMGVGKGLENVKEITIQRQISKKELIGTWILNKKSKQRFDKRIKKKSYFILYKNGLIEFKGVYDTSEYVEFTGKWAIEEYNRFDIKTPLYANLQSYKIKEIDKKIYVYILNLDNDDRIIYEKMFNSFNLSLDGMN